MTTDKQERKETPIARGVLDYFPDAIAEIARVSYIGNQQHNPGEPLHWARGKSDDHADCVGRHLIERGTVDTDGCLHSAKMAWRALALLQLELEEKQKNWKDFSIDPFGDTESAKQRYAFLIQQGCRADVAVSVVKGISESGNGIWELVYLSGPMRGYPEFNFPAFDLARDLLLNRRHDVISPADIDRASGFNLEREGDTPSSDYVYRDFYALLLVAHCKGSLTVLPGWQDSVGASAEVFLARWLGIPVFDVVGRRLKSKTRGIL